MPAPLPKHIAAYYGALRTFDEQGAASEGAVRVAFQNLLGDAGRPFGLTVLAEQTLSLAGKRTIRVDGEVRDPFRIRHGIWEAKDTADDLETEIRKKIDAGYPTRNTIFENTARGVLFQNGVRVLAALHVGYESAAEYPLRHIERTPFTWRVERMRLSPDRTQLVVNPSLTLADIPPEVFEYRLGNRSALEWIVDQYRVKTDRRSGIVSDPNDAEDPEAIVRLVKQVVTVSLETVRIVDTLPALETSPQPAAP